MLKDSSCFKQSTGDEARACPEKKCDYQQDQGQVLLHGLVNGCQV